MQQRHTLAIQVDNESGVLSQVTRLFSRKGYNIESLAVGTTDNPAISHMTIEVLADERHAELLCNQLRKLLPVHQVKRLDTNNAVRRELVLIKVKADSRDVRNEIIQIVNIFRGSIIDVCSTSLTLSLIGAEDKTEAVETLLREFGILELVRTGMIALERGQHTIDEHTKKKGEFHHGKNVL
ncbi:MAG: acetolactate synthase small subunit [Oscillospiraceae bacterium]|nr:acetolactate synthase small subunit [Oscillospiraceae bacterium]